MSSTRLYLSLALAIVLCVVLSSGAAWGISSWVLAGSKTNSAAGAPGKDGVSGHDGSNGVAGSNGAAGSKGAAGSTGAPGQSGANGTAGAKGATGSAGKTGPAGTAGLPGTNGTNGTDGSQGAQGEKGDTGASAPSYSLTSAGGEVDRPVPLVYYPIGDVTQPVPAGPTLIGYSVPIADEAAMVTCQLEDANTGMVMIPAGTAQNVAFDDYTTFSSTQVVFLSSPASLQIWCSADSIDPLSYSAPTVYAVSFAN